MIIYPESGYNSWISEDEADEYFETRLNTDKWNISNKEAALMTSFRSIEELNLNIIFNEDGTLSDDYSEIDTDTILMVLKQAQCEQALHELNNDLESKIISGFSVSGLISVRAPSNQKPPDRYSKRALAVLRTYIEAQSISRFR